MSSMSTRILRRGQGAQGGLWHGTTSVRQQPDRRDETFPEQLIEITFKAMLSGAAWIRRRGPRQRMHFLQSPQLSSNPIGRSVAYS
jgi:hypothetical protein